uniref:Uncharacterized protein n=1 Tax=Anopheles merus TaxID=30066 RepID=A0A182V136_ANOME
MKEERRDFLLPAVVVLVLPLLVVAAAPVAAASSRLSIDDFRFSKRVLGRATDSAEEVVAAGTTVEPELCWKRVLRCFGTGVSFRLMWLPRSAASNGLPWNCRYSSSIGLAPRLRSALAYVSELSTLARSPLLLLLLMKVPPPPPPVAPAAAPPPLDPLLIAPLAPLVAAPAPFAGCLIGVSMYGYG